tara:strand:- start:5930 stop:7366 length:1437 start_codon:yes stop_codon:yes gene_type:complete
MVESVGRGLSDLLRQDAEDLERGFVPFREFIELVKPNYQFYRHCDVLIDALQKVADGNLKRLMVFMPPRNGKSETVSRLFPAYMLYRFPERFFGLCSYSADLAHTLSRNARANFLRNGGQMAEDAQAVKQWETPQGGGMWSAGVGGSITGKGYDCGLIDDPLKNAEEAQSEITLEKQWDWWQSTFFTRAEPDASIIIMLTRWTSDDIAGKLLSQEKDGRAIENWHIINFEAIKSERETMFPDTCTVQEDWREAGEALCPERQPLSVLEQIRESVGSYWWSALYQQSPTAQEGNLWRREWFNTYDELPRDQDGDLLVHSRGFDWDTAYTSNEKNAANAFIESYRNDRGDVYIDNFDFRWCEEPELVKWMSRLGGPHYVEAKATGKSAVSWLAREGIVAIEVNIHGGGDKVAKTRSVTPRAEAGKIFVNKRILNRLLDDDKQGILSFPNSKWKDVNDALIQAINRHVGKRATGKQKQWTF